LKNEAVMSIREKEWQNAGRLLPKIPRTFGEDSTILELIPKNLVK